MRFFKNVLVYLLIAALIVTCIPPMEAAAVTDIPAGTENAEDDGLLIREYSDFAGEYSKQRTVSADSNSLTHNDKFSDYIIENGIDISHHNGVVDWEKVKADGVDFVILRMAYRGYGSSGNIKQDNYAYENLNGARAAGLDIGVYFFSQAITIAEAKEEADYILDMIKDYDIDLPVVMDFEYTAGEAGRLYAAKLTKRQKTNICLAFCEKVEAAGYDAMVYANKSMLTSGVYADEIDVKYEIWLAEWAKKASYDNDYTYWQYTSDGSVDGVPSERVDLDVRYVEASLKITDYTHDSVSLEWMPFEGAEGYILYRKTVGGEYTVAAETDGETLTYQDKGLTTNTCYDYKLNYFMTDENGEKQIYDTGYPDKSVKTPLKLQKLTAKASAADAGTVKISWSKEPNAAGYIVQRYNSSKKKYETVKTVTSGNTLSYKNTGCKIGTTYKYRVRAYAEVSGTTKYGSYSDAVTVKTLSELKKPVVTAKPYSYTTNKLSWKKIPGATGYVVQKYNSSTKKWSTIKTIKSGSTVTCSNTYLNCSTTYKYRVKATASLSGKTVSSYYSDTVSAKTKNSRSAVVKNGPLNVRKGAGTKYGKLTTVKKGAKLTVTGSTKTWYKIKIKVKGKYKTGYVLKKYIRLK